MSRNETCPMNERLKFIAELHRDERSMSEVRRLYNASRKTDRLHFVSKPFRHDELLKAIRAVLPTGQAPHIWCSLHSSDSSYSAILNFPSAVAFSLTRCFYWRLTAGAPGPHAWYSYCFSSYGGAATSSWGLTGSRSDRVPAGGR